MKREGVRSIARRYGLKAVILFGSRARGDAKRGSDCDICVSAPHFQGEELGLIGDLCEALGEDVDLCFFERASASLKHTVAMEGKLLYGSKTVFDRLRLRGVKEWQDSRKFVETSGAYLDRRGL